MRKKLMLNLLALLISLIACAVLADIFIGFLYPITRIYEYSPYTDYIVKPNQHVNFISEEFSTKVNTNSMGLRGGEIDLSRQHKIIMLGDSFTFGHGVNDGEAYAYLLQKKLDAKYGEKTVIINAGTNGYDTRREYSYLANYGSKYNPNIVIVNFMFNDALSNSGEYWFSAMPAGWARYIPLKSIAALVEYLKQPKVLLYKLGIKFKGNIRNVDHFDCLREGKCEKGWNATFDYLEKLGQYAKENSISLVIVNIPSQELFDAEKNATFNPNLASEKLSAFCKRRGIEFIDLYNSGLTKEDYFPKDGHWKAAGNEKAAEYVFQNLKITT